MAGAGEHLVAEGSLPVEALDKRGIDERCEIQIARFGVGVANYFEKDLHGAGIGVWFSEHHDAVGFVAFLEHRAICFRRDPQIFSQNAEALSRFV